MNQLTIYRIGFEFKGCNHFYLLNKSVLVGKAMESVRIQSLNEWELCMMDDKSNKETLHVIKQYLGGLRLARHKYKVFSKRLRIAYIIFVCLLCQ